MPQIPSQLSEFEIPHRPGSDGVSDSIQWSSAAAALALIAALLMSSGTRAFDTLRAASYFLRTRRGPAVSMVRLDQQTPLIKDRRYVVVRSRHD